MNSTSLNRLFHSAPYGVRCTFQILYESFTSWLAHRASSKGAALAFYTLFSLTPILVLTIALVGYFFGAETAKGEIITQMRGLMGANGAQAVQALLAAAQDPRAGLIATIVATLLLIVGATSVFVELKASLDELWDTKPSEQQSGMIVQIKTRLRSFGIVLALALLLLISLIVSAALALLEHFIGGFWSTSAVLLAWIASLISYAVIACLFAVIYKMLPEIPLAWKDVWIGSAVTAALFILGKYAIGLYLGNSGVTSSFGAAGSLIALLLWVYYSAQIFFLGAEFTRQYAQHFGSLRSGKSGYAPGKAPSQ